MFKNETLYIVGIFTVILPIISYYIFKHKKIQGYIFGIIAFLKKEGNTFMGKIYYILTVVIMNLVFMNSTLPNLISGYIFGLSKGILLTLIGCVISGIISFYTARYFLKEKILNKVKKNKILTKIKQDEKNLNKEDWFELSILSRIPPIYPYHIVSYFWGITDINILIFILGTTIGVLPSLSLETFIGYKLSNIKNIFKTKHNTYITIIGIVLTIVISILLVIKSEELLEKKVLK